MDDDRDMLLALEQARCAAIERGDAGALEALLSDDYVHIHMTGKVDDRAGHVAAIVARPRKPVRGDLNVRLFGDVAILSGSQTNIVQGQNGEAPKSVVAYCQQVAVKSGGRWRFVSMQLTRQE